MDTSKPTVENLPSVQSTLKRLRRIEGQIRGLQRMVEADADCSAILTQLLAVRSALDAVAPRMVEVYAERCLKEADDGETREKLLRVIQLFLRLT